MSKANRERRQRSSRQDVVKTGSSRRWILVVTAIAVSILVVLIFRSFAPDFFLPSRHPSHERTVWEEIPEAVRQERAVAVAERLFAAAESAARGDIWSEDLARRFRAAVLPAYLRPNGDIMAAQSGVVQDRFVLVVVASAREYAAVGQRMESRFVFSSVRGHFYYMVGEAISDGFLGIVVLHEAVHWDDLHSGREPPTDSRGTEWFLGEARAHTVEGLAIDRWTGGRFLRELHAVLDDPSQSVPWEIDPSVRQPNPQGMVRIQATFPVSAASESEKRWRIDATVIASLLEQATDEPHRARLLGALFASLPIRP